MEHRAPTNPATPSAQSGNSGIPHEGRNVWILTGYGISGLIVFMILAYYFCGFITR